MVRFETRPSGTRIAKSAWSSVMDAVETMPTLFLSAMILGALLSVATFGFPLYFRALAGHGRPGDSTAAVGLHLSAQFVSTLAWAAIAAPVAVAMHRLILLTERKDGVLSIGARHTRLFFVWLVAIRLVWALAEAAASLPQNVGARALSMVVVALIAIVFSIYLAMIFPAVATDVPSENARARIKTSLDLMNGNFWLFVRAAIVTFLPIIVASGLLEFLFLRQIILSVDKAQMPGALGLVAAALLGCLSVFSAALGAAIASWLYAWAQSKERAVIA